MTFRGGLYLEGIEFMAFGGREGKDRAREGGLCFAKNFLYIEGKYKEIFVNALIAKMFVHKIRNDHQSGKVCYAN